jgi:hypothetical protein
LQVEFSEIFEKRIQKCFFEKCTQSYQTLKMYFDQKKNRYLFGGKPPKAREPLLWTDDQQTTNDQRPTTNNQRPTTNNQRPTTNNQRPTTND